MRKRIDSPSLKVETSQASPAEVDVDLLVIGLPEGGSLPESFAGAAGADDVQGGFKKLSVLHPERPGRALGTPLGRDDV